jgi:hypothetical protein
MGLDIKERWTVGGNAPGEPVQPAEIGIGAPVSGLYLREDVEIKCNFMMTKFVRKQLKDALATLVARLMVKSQIQEAVENNKRLTLSSGGSVQSNTMYSGSQNGSQWGGSQHGGSEYGDSNAPTSPRLPMSPPLSGGLDMSFPKPHGVGQDPRFSQQGGQQFAQGQQYPSQQQFQQGQYQQQQYQQGQQYPQQGQYGAEKQGYPSPLQQQGQFAPQQQQHPSQFVSEIDGKQKELYPSAPKPPGPVELP